MKKWKLLSKKDVSPHKWFPIEMRTYRLPNGKITDNFSVTTIGDVAMMVAVTKNKKVVLVRQFKPGANAIMLQLPAGRVELHHANLVETAQHELKEEVGIDVPQERFKHFATLSAFSTKGTEKVFFYFVPDVEFNSAQHLDTTEEIEVVPLTFSKMDKYIRDGRIWCAQTIAGWELAKKHFSL